MCALRGAARGGDDLLRANPLDRATRWEAIGQACVRHASRLVETRVGNPPATESDRALRMDHIVGRRMAAHDVTRSESEPDTTASCLLCARRQSRLSSAAG